jgi:aspartate 1-decarboxylase
MVFRSFLRSKIHRAVVTTADMQYVGSLTIDEALMEAAGLQEFELVQIADVENGSRLETYVLKGERGSGVIGANGAAARLLAVGDHLIIMAWAQVSEPLPDVWKPKIVLVDEENRVVEVR